LILTSILLMGVGAIGVPARGGPPDPAARTEAQNSQIRELVRWAQEQLASLDSRIAAKRAEMTELYRGYNLDERQSRKLLLELNDLQLKTLEVHQTVQLRLRRIVTEPQFERLRARIEGALSSPARPGSSNVPGPQKGTRP
jgi:Spy/CpxP family protein refolding chaperone